MMNKVKDILLDEKCDLLIHAKTGDFIIDESDSQHIENIMRAAPGHYRQYPLIGANVMTQSHGNLGAAYRRNLAINLEYDGYVVKDISMDNGAISIDADRK